MNRWVVFASLSLCLAPVARAGDWAIPGERTTYDFNETTADAIATEVTAAEAACERKSTAERCFAKLEKRYRAKTTSEYELAAKALHPSLRTYLQQTATVFGSETPTQCGRQPSTANDPNIDVTVRCYSRALRVISSYMTSTGTQFANDRLRIMRDSSAQTPLKSILGPAPEGFACFDSAATGSDGRAGALDDACVARAAAQVDFSADQFWSADENLGRHVEAVSQCAERDLAVPGTRCTQITRGADVYKAFSDLPYDATLVERPASGSGTAAKGASRPAPAVVAAPGASGAGVDGQTGQTGPDQMAHASELLGSSCPPPPPGSPIAAADPLLNDCLSPLTVPGGFGTPSVGSICEFIAATGSEPLANAMLCLLRDNFIDNYFTVMRLMAIQSFALAHQKYLGRALFEDDCSRFPAATRAASCSGMPEVCGTSQLDDPIRELMRAPVPASVREERDRIASPGYPEELASKAAVIAGLRDSYQRTLEDLADVARDAGCVISGGHWGPADGLPGPDEDPCPNLDTSGSPRAADYALLLTEVRSSREMAEAVIPQILAMYPPLRAGHPDLEDYLAADGLPTVQAFARRGASARTEADRAMALLGAEFREQTRRFCDPSELENGELMQYSGLSEPILSQFAGPPGTDVGLRRFHSCAAGKYTGFARTQATINAMFDIGCNVSAVVLGAATLNPLVAEGGTALCSLVSVGREVYGAMAQGEKTRSVAACMAATAAPGASTNAYQACSEQQYQDSRAAYSAAVDSALIAGVLTIPDLVGAGAAISAYRSLRALGGSLPAGVVDDLASVMRSNPDEFADLMRHTYTGSGTGFRPDEVEAWATLRKANGRAPTDDEIQTWLQAQGRTAAATEFATRRTAALRTRLRAIDDTGTGFPALQRRYTADPFASPTDLTRLSEDDIRVLEGLRARYGGDPTAMRNINDWLDDPSNLATTCPAIGVGR